MIDAPPKLNARELAARRGQAVLDLAKGGTKDRPVSNDEFREHLFRHGLGRVSERHVKQIVANLRAAGHCIGAIRGAREDEEAGYWYAVTKAEKRECLLPYWKQIHTSIKTARAMAAGLEEEEALQKMEQLSLLDEVA